jgi:hypothetical protein
MITLSSFTMSLWWTLAHNDISGGFTLGAWFIAAATFPIGLISYQHSLKCKCWGNSPYEATEDEV